MDYGKKRTKSTVQNMPFYCHFLPLYLNGKAGESPAWTPKLDETRHAQGHCYQGVLAPCRVSAPKTHVVYALLRSLDSLISSPVTRAA